MKKLIARSCLVSAVVVAALVFSQSCGPSPTTGTGGGTGGATGGGTGGGATGGGTGESATGGGTGGSATGGGTGGSATGGGTGGGATGGGTGGASGTVTFTTVYTTIIANRCAPCHTTSSGIGITQGTLDMTSKATAYASLVNVAAAGSACAGQGTRVVPGNPGTSILYLKVNLTDPAPCGAKMPFGLAALPQSEVNSIRDWIQQGALNN